MNARDNTTRLDIEPRPWRAWRTSEVATLTAHYATLGPAGCVDLLPGRSYAAIATQARKLGLQAPTPITQPGGPKNLRRRWAHLFTPEFDARVRALYQQPPQRGLVRATAAALGVPRDVLFARARKLGLTVPRLKEPPWTQAEERLLEEHAHQSPSHVQQIFKRAGFTRSATAIDVRRRRLKLDKSDPDHMTARQLGAVMGVDGSTVVAWIRTHGLKARMQGTNRTGKQGGDYHRIALKDVRTWMRDHPRLVDLRKVDRFWFFELALGAPRHDG